MSDNSYFKNFGVINYDFTIKGESNNKDFVVDLMQRIALNITEDDLKVLCEDYIVQDGATPEQMAYALYNDQHLHWTILYVNGITDLHGSWPLSDNALSDFVTKKYGAGNENNAHHFVKMPEGIIIDEEFCISTYGEAPLMITNYDYELDLNFQKSLIRVIKPEYMTAFIAKFNQAFVNG